MKETTGERIKRLRIERKMSVTEFAEKVGTSRMQIYRYESDKIEKMPYKVLVPIAKVLGTTPMYLLGNDDNQSHAKLDNRVNQWISVVGETEFTDEEFNELANFAKYLISKRASHE